MSYLKTKLINHRQRVCRLYKGCLKNLKSYYWPHIGEWRYHATMLRAQFDKHKTEIDLRKVKQLILLSERTLWEQRHPQPLVYPDSPGGNAYAREPTLPDWLCDQFYPIEKKQFPIYFARRYQRKKEYIERWEKIWGPEVYPERYNAKAPST